MLEKREARPSPEEIEAKRRAKTPYQNPRTTERELEIARLESEKNLEEARVDALTGIPNRRGFEQRLRAMYGSERAQDKNRNPAFAFVMVDTDKFKTVNDTLGHPMGDEVLKTLAAYLQNHIRSTDVVCRYGGEEFLIALDVAGVDEEKREEVAMQYAEKLRQGIEELYIHLPGKDTKVTVSMGVADGSSVRTFENVHAIIEAADKALYAAKQGGRNLAMLAPRDDEKRIAA